MCFTKKSREDAVQNSKSRLPFRFFADDLVRSELLHTSLFDDSDVDVTAWSQIVDDTCSYSVTN